MVNETVHIDLCIENATVKCNFTLMNPGENESMLVGFPVGLGWDWIGDGPYTYPLENFKAYVDSQPVETEMMDVNGSQWMVWNMSFDEMEIADVGVSYWVPLSSYGNYGREMDYWFTYVLKTGAAWGGVIEEANVTMDIHDIEPDWITELTPDGYVFENNTITWNFTSIEPTENIYIEFRTLRPDCEQRYTIPGFISDGNHAGIPDATVELHYWYPENSTVGEIVDDVYGEPLVTTSADGTGGAVGWYNLTNLSDEGDLGVPINMTIVARVLDTAGNERIGIGDPIGFDARLGWYGGAVNVTIDLSFICVNETGWWRGVCVFNASDTPIQAAVDNATGGDTIYVYNGSYNENVDVYKRITLIGEGADVVTVTAASAEDHVFEVTVNWVNISGFTATGAIDWGRAGIYLDRSVDHCNIFRNNASNNYHGIVLQPSSNCNTLQSNTANSNNDCGISLLSSSNSNSNILDSNTASNNSRGIWLQFSNDNVLMDNTASNNSYGISLYSSSNNTLQGNTADSNTYYGICLLSSSNNSIHHNNLINNTYSNAYDDRNNAWDNGYPSGGNYYYDYNGADNNTDGIGDTSYPIPGGSSVDHYPLTEPYEYSTVNPPIASFTHTTDGLTVLFTSTSYDPDGNITTHIWNFGDGKTSDAQNPTHTYQIQGDYQVTLTVTDNDGYMASKTETISVGGGVITRVDHPSDLPLGTELTVEVNTDIETDVTLSIGTFLQTKHGTDVVFNVDTTTLGTGEHTLTITAGTESYTDSVIIYDPEVYQTILRGLEDINACSKDEMREISGKTGYALTNHAYTIVKGIVGDATAEYVLSQLRDMLQNMSNTVASELQKFKNILGIDGGYQVDDLDVATILIDNIKECINIDNAPVNDEDIVESINEYVTKPAVYDILCGDKANSVDNRTQVAKSNLGVYYTQTELDEINGILLIGKEAIRNTDDERIYHFYCAEPTLNYFAEMHIKSLNPSKWCICAWWVGCWCSDWVDPSWMWDMTFADAQSILTVPAYIGWIDATPDDEEMRPAAVTMFDPVTVLITAIKMYMDYSTAIEMISPYVIDGGMIVSTDLLAQEVDEEHADIIQAISEITQQSGVEAPKLMNEDLYVSEGNILVTTSPDGKIRNFRYVKSDSILSAPDNNRIVSLNTGWSQSFTPESRNISITISSNQYYYNIGDTVNLTVNISSDTYVDGAMVWISVPEEDLTIKDLLDVTGDMSLNYNFTFQNATLHVPRVHLTDFGVILAENHTSFDIVSVQSPPGGEEHCAGLISISRDEFYDPGVVSLNVTVYNTGDTSLNSEVLYFGSDPYLNGSIDIPTLQVGESTTEQLTFEITHPDRYVMHFILNSSNGALDYNIARFTVTAIDTLLAFPSTDKSIYNTNEVVNIDVTIKNVTLNEVDFPHSLEIIAPSGDIISSASFTPDQ
ncbi:MAG TPA: PKD domain-containing protein, partial [Methanosarcinales archaeon]|nr:PKD domain-containing protein [Methanosarcinales archaeon]